MRATVYKSTGSWYMVRDGQGRMFQSRIKGVFKIEGLTSTNPVAVGDEVEIELEEGPEKAAIITAIHERRNYINRQSPAHRMQHHIVAANVDQSLLIATLKEPRTSQGFIDRFLVACEAYHVPAVIVFNKTDLYRDKEMTRLGELKEMYEAIGYRVMPMSVQNREGLGDLRTILEGKTSLFSGHSGVGKSSLINYLIPDLDLRTRDVSGWSGKGLHTTTFAEMFDLPWGGRIIDTPGIREFGLVDISRQELSHYFPEKRELVPNCQFNNCLHMNEPGCAVKEAVQQERIHLDRYVSYCTILDSIGERNY